jgi:hypothetical protein
MINNHNIIFYAKQVEVGLIWNSKELRIIQTQKEHATKGMNKQNKK